MRRDVFVGLAATFLAFVFLVNFVFEEELLENVSLLNLISHSEFSQETEEAPQGLDLKQ